jgi:hypothetical protein
MTCEEKRRLINAYGEAVKNYSTSVADLNLTRGKIPKGEYERLLDLSEKARRTSDKARVTLERHVAEHGC